MWCPPGKDDRVIHYLAAGAASEGPVVPVSAEKSASGAFLTAGSQTTRQEDYDWWETRHVQGTVLCEVWDPALEVDLASAYTRGLCTQGLWLSASGCIFALLLMNPELLRSCYCSFREDRQKVGIAGWMSSFWGPLKEGKDKGQYRVKRLWWALLPKGINWTHKPYLSGWQRCTAYSAVSTIWITAFPLISFHFCIF